MTKFLVAGLFLFLSTVSLAAPTDSSAKNVEAQEWNPRDPRAMQILNEFDAIYESETGQSPWLYSFFNAGPRCARAACPVWLQVVKSTQRAYLYINGKRVETWKVSTGRGGFETIDFDGNPNGRIYDKYTSTKFPEGDYKGLGNMPYAIFFYEGYAIHGTPESNFSVLGRPASHGCVRLHPDNAYKFNRLTRENGIRKVWITVQW